MKVIVSTDGSGTSSGPGGWAAVLRFGGAMREISGGVPEATNNRMEIQAVIEGLRVLNRPCDIELTTDSEYVKNGIEQNLRNWIRYGWMTKQGDPVKNRDLWEQLNGEMQRHRRVLVSWTPGHADHVDNCRCDELAGAERRKLLPEKPKPARKPRARAVAA